jgi:PTH2 family peptidyl-tRNA hydrolase
VIKQIIVMRKDLNMRKGKMCAQAAHASMAVLLQFIDLSSGTHGLGVDLSTREWLGGLFTKICVSVDSEAELDAVVEAARAAGLPHALITDSGATEFNGVPTKTCCAIGPAPAESLQPITGHLKLL